MKNLRVLLTAAGSPSAPGLIKCLKNNGEREIYVVGTDMKTDPTILQMVDKCRLVPASNAPEYIDVLLNICKEEKIDVLIPGVSAELMGLSRRIKEFEAVGTKVSVSSPYSIDVCNNKFLLYDFMEKAGLKTPKYYKVQNVNDLKEACVKLGYPQKGLCVKATESSGSRGIRIIDPTKSRFDILFGEKPNSFFISLDELLIILSEKDEMPEMMAMEYLPGEEYSVDVLADNGKILYMAGRESNVILASIPQMATISKNEAAYKISEDIVRELKIDGNIDLDFKMDENGQPVLMEINARLAATLAVFAAAGVNLLYLRVKQLLGEELPEVKIDYGTVMKRRYLEQYVNSKGEPVYI